MTNLRSFVLLASGAIVTWMLVPACASPDVSLQRSKDDDATRTPDGGAGNRDDDDTTDTPSPSTPSTGSTSRYDAGPQTIPSTARVVCAGVECALGQACCATGANAGKCIEAGGSCLGGKFTCDDSADCPSGQKCCASRFGSKCSAEACSFLEFQMCASTTDCGAAGECSDKTCGEIIGTGQEFKIRTCGAPPLGCAASE